jgi:protein SCO1/2
MDGCRPATVGTRAPARPRSAALPSAALSLTLSVLFACGLYRYTHGFEVWTFEGRRQLQVYAGALQAAPVPLVSAYPQVHPLWHEGATDPAAYLVDFVYTRCPGLCRALGSEYQQMQHQLALQQHAEPALARVHLVSISFDVDHDDATELARLATRLGADPLRWTFAVPATSRDAVRLLRSLGVVAVPDGQGGFVHNGAIHLLDEQGRLRGLFALDEWPQALKAAGQSTTAPRAELR